MRLILLFTLLLSVSAIAQEIDYQKDSLLIRQIFDEALVDGHAYEDLRSLCKDIGARLSGSAEAEMAVVWGQRLLESYGFDTWLQQTPIPHWERGTKEVAYYETGDGKIHRLKVLALGHSIGTNGLLQADLVMVDDIEHLNEMGANGSLENKVVFINKPFDQRYIKTFQAYGACWPIRGIGASEAAKYGARAVVIRSLATPIDDHPHTGSMRYEDESKKIPGAAISTMAADELAESLKSGPVTFSLEMDCRTYPDKTSHNVIGEIKGSQFPDEYITIGGHLDSWDVGEGAHDDGAGIIHCVEALRIMKELGIKPKRTIRIVMFMNEENGAYGAKTYAQEAKEKGEKHVFALESDAGGHTPYGFGMDGSQERIEFMKSFSELLRPYGIYELIKGWGGVDINKLKDHYEEICLIGFMPDSQRYFNYHHSEEDVFENVNKRELELGCASIASIVYLLDKYWDDSSR